LLRRQRWSPFTLAPYEFVCLNFDFHPQWMARALRRAGFAVEAGRAVSHFRHPLFKRIIPPQTLAAVDGLIQSLSAAWKLSPSVFLRARGGDSEPTSHGVLFRCPSCHGQGLQAALHALRCAGCSAVWGIVDGIYDFKTPIEPDHAGSGN